jgi:hypothetical protein
MSPGRTITDVVAGARNSYCSTGRVCGLSFEFPVTDQRFGVGLKSSFCRAPGKVQDSKKILSIKPQVAGGNGWRI